MVFEVHSIQAALCAFSLVAFEIVSAVIIITYEKKLTVDLGCAILSTSTAAAAAGKATVDSETSHIKQQQVFF